jgi:ribosomal protein S18 acetylase RimI-like enzyme
MTAEHEHLTDDPSGRAQVHRAPRPRASIRNTPRLPASAAIDRNMQEYWLSFGQTSRGSVRISDQLSFSYSGGPYFNRVMGLSLDSALLSEAIQETHEFFRQRNAAATWLLTPASQPENAAVRLTDHGCTLQERWIGMAAGPADVNWSETPQNAFSIRKVRSFAQLELWTSLVAEIYRLPDPARDLLFNYFRDQGSEAHDRWCHYLAFVDDRPVASASSFFGTGEAGIYLVGTLPEARRRGFARELTREAIRDAVARGYDLIVLQSTPEGYPLYKRMGFIASHTIDVLRWEPSALRRRVRRIRASLR